MKNYFFRISAVVLLAATLVTGVTSCNDTENELVPADASLKASAATITLPQIISSEMTLDAANLYLLDNKTFVIEGGILNIPAGTRIEGVYKTDPNTASALVVCRGGKINATGTSTHPVVFTAHVDSNNPTVEVGDWGGVILLGKAPTNQGSDVSIEGINPPAVPTSIDYKFGGSVTNDNSGVLSYVRVEYAGASISADNEINSFTFGGVGSGTTLDHLEAYYGADDSFEFFGGTVNANYLLSVSPNDDSFDFDFGYSGKLQFLVAVLDPDAPYSSNGNGIECDNDASGSSSLPLTHPIISNLTIVGASNGETSSSTGTILYGTHFRRNCRFVLRNSVVYGFNTAIFLNGSEVYSVVSDDVTKTNDTSVSVFANNVVGKISTSTALWNNSGWTPGSSNSLVEVADMGIYLPFSMSRYFTGTKGLKAKYDPALTGADFTGLDGFTETTYKGALSGDNYWIAEDWVKSEFPNSSAY